MRHRSARGKRGFSTASTYGITGDFTKGIHYTEKALKKSRSIGNLTREAHAISILSTVQHLRGNWNECLSGTTRGYEIANQIGNVITAGIALLTKGICQFYLGNLEKGIEWMRDGIHQIETIGSRFTLSAMYAFISEANAVAGNREDAFNCGKNALEFTQFGEKVGESSAYKALAMAAALEMPPDWKGVDTHMGESIRLSEERGASPVRSLAHFRHAECLHKKGDLDAAREQLDQAEALFRDMGMDWWTVQAEGLQRRLDQGEPFKGFAPYVDGPPTAE